MKQSRGTKYLFQTQEQKLIKQSTKCIKRVPEITEAGLICKTKSYMHASK
jgi:hypothetical protein